MTEDQSWLHLAVGSKKGRSPTRGRGGGKILITGKYSPVDEVEGGPKIRGPPTAGISAMGTTLHP